MPAQDAPLKAFNIALNGRLITKLDGTQLPDNCFQELENFRYNDGGIEPIKGMTAISADLLNPIRNGFHFKKDSPVAEDYVFLQVGYTLYKSDTLANVPNLDTYSSFLTMPSLNTIYFTDAPDQSMVFCDGYKNYVWSGDEYRVASFINFDGIGDAATAQDNEGFYYNFTEQVINTLSDANNCATLHNNVQGNDRNTSGLWHFNSALTDSSGNGLTLTSSGTFAYTTGIFGNCAVFNGADTYLYRASNSLLSFEGGVWTFDGKFYITSLAANRPLFSDTTVILKWNFKTGTNDGVAPVVGKVYYAFDVVTAKATTLTLRNVYISSGDWSTGDAKGTMYYEYASGSDALTANCYLYTGTNQTGTLVCLGDGAEGSAGNNYITAYVDTNGAIHLKIHETYKTAADVLDMYTADSVIAINTWYHIEIVENGNNFYIFTATQVLGANFGSTTLLKSSTSAFRGHLYQLNFNIGRNPNDGPALFAGRMEEVRFSTIARHTTAWIVQQVPYGTADGTYIYVGATRPLQGVKFYVGTGNATACVPTVNYWNGSSWTDAPVVSDTTDVGGASLGQIGTIMFDDGSLVSSTKQTVIRNSLGFWYRFRFPTCDDNVVVYCVTVNAPVQAIQDIWDGVPRQIYSLVMQTSVFSDWTKGGYAMDYASNDPSTYADVSSLTSTQALYFGFNERMMGMKVDFGGTNVNTTNATLTVSYWNGKNWTSVGTIVDGTSNSGISFAQTGIITWNTISVANEFVTSIGNSAEWYYYRLTFSNDLAAPIFIDNVSGIPEPKEIRAYRYPILWQNRLWLLNDQSENKNEALGSSYGTVCVFNGTDSGSLVFGGMKELMAAQSLFTRYGSNLYENLIVCKRNETYLVDGFSFATAGQGQTPFVVYEVSGTRGCIAPLTMKSCDTGYEIAQGITKHTVCWLSSSGVVMFDSNSMIELSNDIGDRFFTDGANSILRSLANQSAAFYDPVKNEYHLLIPVGTSATYLNEEWVYDVVRKKWWKANRPTDKHFWCGFITEDAYGNEYVYGGSRDGFLERLEYGSDFDGSSITYKFRIPDILFDKSWDTRKELRDVRLVGKCRTTTTQKITMNHYGDGATATTTPAVPTISNNKAGRRFYKFMRSMAFIADTHSLEFTISTDDEALGGFEPLFVGGHFRAIDYDREDV